MTALRHTRRNFLKTVGAGTAALALPPLLGGVEPEAGRRMPNIVVIFTDDQGYSDIGVYGARGFQTPNLDRTAMEGVRFTDFYVAQPVCSASRAALLTGCYPNRIGITGALWPGSKHGLHEREVTIAELCKSRGYATSVFGKWHLGHQPQFLPTRHGFDEFCGLPYSNDMWPLHPDFLKLPPDSEKRKRGYPDLPLYEGEDIVNTRMTPEDQKQFTSKFTRRAVDLIERNKGRPFFLYLAHPMPHVPLFVSDKFKGKSHQGLYGDVILEIDWSVGQILDAVQQYGLDDDTLVVFTSDNGPWLSYGNHAGSARTLREGKGTTWEGGVREPCIMRWPGRIPAGSVCREPAMTIDIFPTIARLIGARLPDHRIDGKDIWSLISGQPGARSPHGASISTITRTISKPCGQAAGSRFSPKYRSLTGPPGQDGTPHGYSRPTCGLELYDLENNVGERHNVINQHPEVVKRLQALAEKVRDDLGDALTDRPGKNRRPPGKL